MTRDYWQLSGLHEKILCRFSIVDLNQATELLPPSNEAFTLWHECFVDAFGFHSEPPMWAHGITIRIPDMCNVVKLIQVEAHEVIQINDSANEFALGALFGMRRLRAPSDFP